MQIYAGLSPIIKQQLVKKNVSLEVADFMNGKTKNVIYITNRTKYKNKKTEIDGITFASKKEAERYLILKHYQKKRIISDLKIQPRYTLQCAFKKNGIAYRKIEYVADFQYLDSKGRTVVEDTKGFLTDVFKIKQKLFEYNFPDMTIRVI